MADTNGNGRAGTSWAAAAICSTVVLALGSAFGSSYVRDQNRMEQAIRALEDERESNAYVRGVTIQRLDEIEQVTARLRERIEQSVRDLDATLQREMRILDEQGNIAMDNLDRRLQTEMGGRFDEQRARLDGLRAWVDAASLNRWTKDDQRRFEDQLGVTLKP